MDESAYHASRRTVNPSPCVFERAILADCAQCELSRRHALAEREVVACSLEVARINCMTLESLFHERARFALRLPGPGVPMVHAKAMQLLAKALLAGVPPGASEDCQLVAMAFFSQGCRHKDVSA